MKGFEWESYFIKYGFKWLRVVFYGFKWLILADHLLGFLWRQVAFNGLKWLIVVLIMSDGKQSYRVNFTMPKPDSALNSKINELFLRHRDIGTLRHWLMSLATEAARKELGVTSEPPSAKPKTAPEPAKPKKIESFADLLPDDLADNEPVPSREKSKELDAYDSLCVAVKSDGAYNPNDIELEDALAGGRPLKLSDHK